ncbi:hypothetical protein [Mycobacterium sp. 852002-50816_SCH5313054-b]|uniref:hypothetical protein n=1 Tax=Mycobacterium sp. 852002-50816_SCH5313054-b TaxID=1834092 RepID=UPI00082EC49E|nr:hypothetical protein [Mycobacterium sp. 852002-50816_SCH5313054-b]
MKIDRNSHDDESRCESVFRQRWRDRQSAAARPGELIRQQGWIDAGLVALWVLTTAGAVAAGTISVAQTDTLPAVAQDSSVTAARGSGPPPAQGTAAQFRDPSGTTQRAVVVEVTATDVRARLDRPVPAPAGELIVPTGRQRLISVLLPGLR